MSERTVFLAVGTYRDGKPYKCYLRCPDMKSKIVLLGPPGCGKGTQAELLSDRLGFVRLSTGDMLREAVRNKTDLGKKAKEYMDAGALVPNDLIISLMKSKIEGLSGAFLLDGFPRTIEQADALSKEIDIDAAINLDVEDKELIDRLTKRRSCPDCNSVYHLLYKPPKTEGTCDKCGGKLYQRDDDAEKTVRNRLNVYRDNTFPLIEYYKKEGKLITVMGVGSIDDIFSEIEKALR
ncbi:MAG: adenylate kinase [Candidatus Methanomethylophilaceae archaeon]